MKSIISVILTTATALLFAGCNHASTKITTIPMTTASEDAKTFCTQGLALLDAGDFPKSKSYFIKAIQADSNFSLAYLFKVSSDFSPKDLVADITKAKAVLDTTKASDWEKWYSDLYATFLSDDYNRRIEICQKIVNQYPDAARAQADLGVAYQSGNQFDKARECFQKAIALDSTWVGGYYNLSNSYMFNDPKDFQKAEDNAMKTVQLAPQDAVAQAFLGDAYRAANKLSEAKDAYTKAISIDPQGAFAYYKIGHINSFLGNYDEARKNYEDAMKRDDEKFSRLTDIACTWLYAGDYKKALQYLDVQLVKIDSSGESADKKTNDKLTCLYAAAQIAFHYNEAAKLKEITAMIEPLNTETGNIVGTNEAKIWENENTIYNRSTIDILEGKYDSAKAKAEEIKMILDPIRDPTKLSDYNFILGEISMRQKKYPDAISHFENTNQAQIYDRYCLAMADEMGGDKNKADALYKGIADYNFNEVGYALIRNEVKKKKAAP